MEVRRTLVFLLFLLILQVCKAQDTLKICVKEEFKDACDGLEHLGINLKCVAGKTKYDCMRMVRDEKADIVRLQPPEIYTAGSFFNLDVVATNVNVQANDSYRYRVVAIVKNSSNIKKLDDLKGKKACFNSVTSAEGWDIPVGILLNKLHNVGCEKENEASTISSFFESVCAPGNLSMDAQVNDVIKKESKNLCSLCVNPEDCNKNDPHYDSLNCLVDSSADVAFTTLDKLEKFSKLDEIISNYSFLCLNNSIVPLKDINSACIWAKMPTDGYLTKKGRDISRKIEQIAMEFNEEVKTNPREVLQNVFGSNVTLALNENGWKNYLGNYINAANRTLSCQRKVRLCTKSKEEFSKCEGLMTMATGRYLRPIIECVQENSSQNCIEAIKNGHADLVPLNGRDVYAAGRYEDMLPLVSEEYSEDDNVSYFAVAVIKANSTIQKLEDLKGKKSCHTAIGRNAGWILPINRLVESDLMKIEKCNVAGAVADFFSESCAPGAKDKELNPSLSGTDKLCKLCKDPESCSISDLYSGYSGAFRCLVEGGGDVAFVKHSTVPSLTDRNSTLPWAKDLHSSDYKLVCPDGSTAAISDYARCSLAHVPAQRFVVVSSKMDYNDRVNAAYMLTSSSHLFNSSSAIFQLFGPYNGTSDVLFKDSAISLKSVTFDSKYDQVLNKDYLEALRVTDTKACNSASAVIAALAMIISSIFLSFSM